MHFLYVVNHNYTKVKKALLREPKLVFSHIQCIHRHRQNLRTDQP